MATICKNGQIFSAFLASIIQSDTGRNPTTIILGLMTSRRLEGVHMFTVLYDPMNGLH